MIHWLQYILVRTAVAFFSLFSVPTLTWMARIVGGIIYAFAGKRRAIAIENISRAFGTSLSAAQKRVLAKRSFEHMCISAMELLRVPEIAKTAKQNFRFTGRKNLEDAFAKGKGVLLVCGHLGTWELLAFIVTLGGYPISTVVKRVRNPYFEKHVNGLRRHMGMKSLSKGSSLKSVLRELKGNRIVAILIDQWDGADGLWIDFFGTPTSTTSFPARLAKKTGATLVPAYCLRTAPGQFEINIDSPVALQGNNETWKEETTQALNQWLESKIREHPEQWLWAHRRWKPKPT